MYARNVAYLCTKVCEVLTDFGRYAYFLCNVHKPTKDLANAGDGEIDLSVVGTGFVGFVLFLFFKTWFVLV